MVCFSLDSKQTDQDSGRFTGRALSEAEVAELTAKFENAKESRKTAQQQATQTEAEQLLESLKVALNMQGLNVTVAVSYDNTGALQDEPAAHIGNGRVLINGVIFDAQKGTAQQAASIAHEIGEAFAAQSKNKPEGDKDYSHNIASAIEGMMLARLCDKTTAKDSTGKNIEYAVSGTVFVEVASQELAAEIDNLGIPNLKAFAGKLPADINKQSIVVCGEQLLANAKTAAGLALQTSEIPNVSRDSAYLVKMYATSIYETLRLASLINNNPNAGERADWEAALDLYTSVLGMNRLGTTTRATYQDILSGESVITIVPKAEIIVQAYVESVKQALAKLQGL